LAAGVLAACFLKVLADLALSTLERDSGFMIVLICKCPRELMRVKAFLHGVLILINRKMSQKRHDQQIVGNLIQSPIGSPIVQIIALDFDFRLRW
jgi:hypothetical protein